MDEKVSYLMRGAGGVRVEPRTSPHDWTRYHQLVKALPSPSKATKEDIFFVAKLVDNGPFEFAYMAKGSEGIELHKYAHVIFEEFADGRLGNETERLVRASKLNRGVSKIY